MQKSSAVEKGERIKDFIKRYRRENDGYSPSLREIAVGTGMPLSTVHARLRHLSEVGEVVTNGRMRGWRVVA